MMASAQDAIRHAQSAMTTNQRLAQRATRLTHIRQEQRLARIQHAALVLTNR
jgi:hypothetical protein